MPAIAQCVIIILSINVKLSEKYLAAILIMLSSPIEEIKNRLDIIEVIGNYIKLQKAGANYRSVCPFHSEKGPSFFVSPARQIWHCFGCGLGGDIFKFVMRIEGVEFGDALRILAQKAGVELKPLRRESVIWKSERQRLYEINELAAKFFEKQLEGSAMGKGAKDYLLKRKISGGSIKNWRLGYSPDAWRGLLDFLLANGYKREEVERTGLVIKGEKGTFYDRFRGRIMFPVFDLNSQIVGFGGRVFKDRDNKEISKYMNTPNTPLYDKSRVLYGLDKAKMEIRKKNCSILVEGYVDAIMCHQEGFGNVVAVSGTALTPYHLKILKRYSDNICTAFDMDIGGDSATKRGTDLAQILGFNIKVIMMAQDKDPADILFENPKNWEKFQDEAKSILAYYFETAFSRFDRKTPEGKREISKILLPVIKRLQNQIERAYWVQELARRLAVREEDVIEELKKVKLEEDLYGLEKEEVINLPQKSRKDLLEERTMVLLLNSPEDCLNSILKEDMEMFSEKTGQLILALKKDKKINTAELSQELADLFNYFSLKAEVESEISKKDLKEDFENCLRNIRSLELKNKLQKNTQFLREAEHDKDQEKIKKFAEESDRLAKKLNSI